MYPLVYGQYLRRHSNGKQIEISDANEAGSDVGNGRMATTMAIEQSSVVK